METIVWDMNLTMVKNTFEQVGEINKEKTWLCCIEGINNFEVNFLEKSSN